MKTKLAKFLPLALMTVTLIGNICMNCSFYINGSDNSEDIIWQIFTLEPIFWLIPIIFLIAWRIKTDESLLSTPLLILTGFAPLFRGIFMLLIAANLDFGWQLMLIFEILTISFHPIASMLIQTIAMTLLWIDAISKESEQKQLKAIPRHQ